MHDDDDTYGPRARHQLDDGRDPDDVVASLVQDGVDHARARGVVQRILRDEPRQARLRGIAMLVGGLVIAWTGFGAARWTSDFADAVRDDARAHGRSTPTSLRRGSPTRAVQMIAFGGGVLGLATVGLGVRALVSGGRKLDGKRSVD